MKLILVACFLGLTLGHPTFEPITSNYHEDIGIKDAVLIKAGEESTDFDGSRIVGGFAASLGQYPYLGGLVISLTSGWTSVCGSSLVTNNRLVTAAHCWRDVNSQAWQFTVVLGSITLFTGGTRINTNQVVMHPNYNAWTLHNDIAVISIASVFYTTTIRNIPIASGSATFAGNWAWAAGFGAQGDGTGGIPTNQRLHQVQLQVITNADCARTFGSTVIATTLCVSGAGGRSTCGGDSGGPLELNIGGVRTLIGVVNFGARAGCQLGFPTGFARVTAFNAWIRSLL